ncbi:transposase [Nonomuraea sp. NPDC049709]|uniref:transposase n=1 Tax=Nonomuraea sp. NPDC049709 TaxID=3154736 RepID=UPI00343A539A
MRINHQYDRGGSLAYLAAYDVHQAHVIGHGAAKTGIVAFMTLVEKVMTAEPYASAKRVFWVVDSGSSHRGKAAADRLAAQFPNAAMVHTPVHASWLNQIEIFFSIVQRKVVTPNDFTNLDQVEDRLIAFERRYNETARPFRWKFTPADLEDLMTGSSDTNRRSTTPSSQPAAATSLPHYQQSREPSNDLRTGPPSRPPRCRSPAWSPTPDPAPGLAWSQASGAPAEMTCPLKVRLVAWSAQVLLVNDERATGQSSRHEPHVTLSSYALL